MGNQSYQEKYEGLIRSTRDDRISECYNVKTVGSVVWKLTDVFTTQSFLRKFSHYAKYKLVRKKETEGEFVKIQDV